MLKQILSAFSITALASLFSLAFSVMTNKILAVGLGPAGVGYWSILNQIYTTALVAGTLGGTGAVVQGLASRKDPEQVAIFCGVTSWIYILTTILAASFLIIFHQAIFSWMFPESVPFKSTLLGWFALPLILSVAHGYLSSIVNANRDIFWLAVMQIVGAALAAILAYPLAILVKAGYWQTFVVFLCITSGVSLLLSVYKCISNKWITYTLKIPWDVGVGESRKFLSYAFGVFGAGLVSNLTILALRALIIDAGGPESVGYFQASWGISMNYIMVILSSMGTYYLPALCDSDAKGQREVFEGVLLVILLVALPAIILMISVRPLLVSLLFSRDFLPATRLLRWMLVGDYLKAISWCFGLLLLANGNIRVFFIKELVINIWFLGLSYLLVNKFPLFDGIGVAFLTMYFINLIFLSYYVKRKFGLFPNRSMVYMILSGFLLVSVVSLLMWNYNSVAIYDYLIAGTACVALIVTWYKKCGGSGWYGK